MNITKISTLKNPACDMCGEPIYGQVIYLATDVFEGLKPHCRPCRDAIKGRVSLAS